LYSASAFSRAASAASPLAVGILAAADKAHGIEKNKLQECSMSSYRVWDPYGLGAAWRALRASALACALLASHAGPTHDIASLHLSGLDRALNKLVGHLIALLWHASINARLACEKMSVPSGVVMNPNPFIGWKFFDNATLTHRAQTREGGLRAGIWICKILSQNGYGQEVRVHSVPGQEDAALKNIIRHQQP
jgi:hypothetical protein